VPHGTRQKKLTPLSNAYALQSIQSQIGGFVRPEEPPDLDKLKEETDASIEKAQNLVDELKIVHEHERSILRDDGPYR
jgi:hypothetical protein